VTLLLIIGIPDSQKVSNKVNLELKDLKELLSNKQYVLSVVIFFILFIVYALDSLTVVDKMIEINSTSDQIGLRWGFQAIVEIPLMIFGFKFIQRFSAKKILGFTALIFGIRYALYGLSETANQMILISVLQAITFPFMLLTQKVLVNDYTPLHLRASGHMVMTAVTSNIPIIIVPLLNTLLHQYISYSQILLLGGILCLIPMILTFKLERVDV
jgi:predicted MFS family arabinose efflux permease